jgi:xanthine/CO dehydrogenase XdhC/CoxF family maturation factor
MTTWIYDELAPHDSPREARVVELQAPRTRMFVATVVPQKELLLLGAGPDALPVVEFATTLGWRVTLVDHRPAYADAERFPRAHRVLAARPGEIAAAMDLSNIDAAVIMSHHLATDLAALEALAPTSIPYLGLLGPAARRRRLLADLDATKATLLDGRLRSPVGLDLGGRDPASIALAIVAEVQAFFHGRGHGGAP